MEPIRGLGLFGVILLSFACVTLAEDKEIHGPLGISVKVLGHSGKIVLIRRFNVTAKGNESEKNDSKPMVKENKVVLIMDAIAEVDEDGNIVGKGGKDKHSFNGFANQDFTFSGIVETTFQNLSVHQFNFTASDIGGTGGTLKVMIFLFDEGGDIDIGQNETEEVRKGSFKFSLQITGWKFCGDVQCKQGKNNEVGAAIDVTITLQSKGGKQREGKKTCGKKGRRCGKSYDIGEGNMTLPNEVEVDGVWMEMEDGYPMFDVKGNKKSIIVRLPKFNTEVLYDPTITLGDEPIEGSGMEPTNAPSVPTTVPASGAHQVGLSIALIILAALSGFFHN